MDCSTRKHDESIYLKLWMNKEYNDIMKKLKQENNKTVEYDISSPPTLYNVLCVYNRYGYGWSRKRFRLMEKCHLICNLISII